LSASADGKAGWKGAFAQETGNLSPAFDIWNQVARSRDSRWFTFIFCSILTHGDNNAN
jgi:hypothetical protein